MTNSTAIQYIRSTCSCAAEHHEGAGDPLANELESAEQEVRAERGGDECCNDCATWTVDHPPGPPRTTNRQCREGQRQQAKTDRSAEQAAELEHSNEDRRPVDPLTVVKEWSVAIPLSSYEQEPALIRSQRPPRKGQPEQGRDQDRDDQRSARPALHVRPQASGACDHPSTVRRSC
jgi:hypothetical protein